MRALVKHGGKGNAIFFGHILRCRSDDPLFQVTFSHTIFSSRTPPLLRPGRPRADWFIETFKDSCYYSYGPDSLILTTDN